MGWAKSSILYVTLTYHVFYNLSQMAWGLAVGSRRNGREILNVKPRLSPKVYARNINKTGSSETLAPTTKIYDATCQNTETWQIHILFHSSIGPNKPFTTRFIGNSFRLIKDPPTGHNKNCKLETPYAAGRSPPLHLWMHCKCIQYNIIRGFQLTVLLQAWRRLFYEPNLFANKTCVKNATCSVRV
jgi:hypothetical protein